MAHGEIQDVESGVVVSGVEVMGTVMGSEDEVVGRLVLFHLLLLRSGDVSQLLRRS